MSTLGDKNSQSEGNVGGGSGSAGRSCLSKDLEEAKDSGRKAPGRGSLSWGKGPSAVVLSHPLGEGAGRAVAARVRMTSPIEVFGFSAKGAWYQSP